MLHGGSAEAALPLARDARVYSIQGALWADVSCLLDSLSDVIEQPGPDIVLDGADDTDAFTSLGSSDNVNCSSPRSFPKESEVRVKEIALELQKLVPVLRQFDATLFEEAIDTSLASRAMDERIASATDELSRQRSELASGYAEKGSLCAQLDERGKTLDAALKFQATLQRSALEIAARRRQDDNLDAIPEQRIIDFDMRYCSDSVEQVEAPPLASILSQFPCLNPLAEEDSEEAEEASPALDLIGLEAKVLNFHAMLERRLEMGVEDVAAERERHFPLDSQPREESPRSSQASSPKNKSSSDSSTLSPVTSAKNILPDSGRRLSAGTPVVLDPKSKNANFQLTDPVEKVQDLSMTPIPSQRSLDSPAEEDVAAFFPEAKAAVLELKPRIQRLVPPSSLPLDRSPPARRFPSQRLPSPQPFRLQGPSVEGREAPNGSPTTSRRQSLKQHSSIGSVAIPPVRSCGASSQVGLFVDGTCAGPRSVPTLSKAVSRVGSAIVQSCASGSPSTSSDTPFVVPIGAVQTPQCAFRRAVSREGPLRSASPSTSPVPSGESSRSRERGKLQTNALPYTIGGTTSPTSGSRSLASSQLLVSPSPQMPSGSRVGSPVAQACVSGSPSISAPFILPAGSAQTPNCAWRRALSRERPLRSASSSPAPVPSGEASARSREDKKPQAKTLPIPRPPLGRYTFGSPTQQQHSVAPLGRYTIGSIRGSVQPAPAPVQSPAQAVRNTPLSTTASSTSSSSHCLPGRPSSHTAITSLRNSSRSASPDASTTNVASMSAPLSVNRTPQSPTTSRGMKVSRTSPRTLASRSPPKTARALPKAEDYLQREGASLAGSQDAKYVSATRLRTKLA